ncbi:GGDEF domain-containing protein [Vibrio fluvialis]
MKLRIRICSMNMLLALLVSAAGVWAAHYILKQVESDILAQTATLLSRYDSQKELAPVLEQVRSVRQLSQEPALMMWAKDSANQALQQHVSQLLTRYRSTMAETRLHLVLDASMVTSTTFPLVQNVSFHHASLAPLQAQDRPYLLAGQNEPASAHLITNIESDTALLRVRSLIQAGKQPVGFVETQTNLATLTGMSPEKNVNGVTTLWVDNQNSIRHNQERTQITNRLNNFPRVLLAAGMNRESIAQMRQVMEKQRNGQEPSSLLLHYQQPAALVALNYIADLDWHQINVINSSQFPALQRLYPFYWLLIGVVWSFCFLVCLSNERLVNRPLAELNGAMRRFWQRRSSQALHFVDKPNTEIGQLMTSAEQYSQAILEAGRQVEHQVAERTSVLDQLSTSDPLTLLLNKRGMEAELRAESARARREQGAFGLVWVDISHYQTLQASLGSKGVEEVLRHVAHSIQLSIREYDAACRWGENEFLILVRNDSEQSLRALAERLSQQCEQPLQLTCQNQVLLISLSIGATLVAEDTDIKEALARADGALYFAKQDPKQNIHIWQACDTDVA